MKELDRAMKYFICFALGSAAVLPILGEVYANISKTAALIFAAAWAVFAGVKFSSLPVKSAMLGITSYAFSSVILSLIGYVIIHPAIRSWLESNSEYFSLPLSDWARYWSAAFSLLLLSYVIYFARLGIKKAVCKFRSNSEASASAIENAFSEDEK
ncbi:MAG: hypothetical protein ACI4JW_10180 [Oscillospiraceae bacterium]